MQINEQLCENFLKQHSVEAVRALETLPEKELGRYLSKLTPEIAARGLERMTSPVAAACLTNMTPGAAAIIATEMSLELRVAALRLMPEKRRDALIERLEGIVARQSRGLLDLRESTISALMEPAGLILSDDLTALEARNRIRKSEDRVPDPLFVVDRTQRLVGMLSMHALLKARRDDQVATIMNRDVPRLHAAESRELLFTSRLWHEFEVLAVVDSDHVLLGVIPHHILYRVRQQAGSETQGGGAMDTMLALGELYWLGLSGVMSGMSSVDKQTGVTKGTTDKEGEE